jgi:hypothetical protein
MMTQVQGIKEAKSFPVTDSVQQRMDGTPTGRDLPTPLELRLIVPPSYGTGGEETTYF